MNEFKINEVVETLERKADEERKKLSLTDEQIEIVYAVATAQSGFNLSVTERRKVYSVKLTAIRNLLAVFRSDEDPDEIVKFMQMKFRLMIYKRFLSYDNEAEYTYVAMDVKDLDTAIDESNISKERFIVAKDEDKVFLVDDENFIYYSLDENILDNGSFYGIEDPERYMNIVDELLGF